MARGIPERQAVGKSTAIVDLSKAVNIKNILYLCLSHWLWFALALIIALCCAHFYILKTPKIYSRTCSILIKADEKSSGSEDLFNELGIKQVPINVNNEISALKTNIIIHEVISRLRLNVEYKHSFPFLDKVVYGIDCPVVVIFHDLNDNDYATLDLELKSDGSIELSSAMRNGRACFDSAKLHIGESCDTPMGKIEVLPSSYYKKNDNDKILVIHKPLNDVISTMSGCLTVTLRDKNSTILDITYKDESPARAEDILNTWVVIYNENGIKSRNQRMVSVNEFIKDRLEVIEHELGDVENVISDYKAENLMTDVSQAGSMAMSQVNIDEQDLRVIDDQIYMIKYIRSYLTDGHHDNQLLPTNLSLTGSALTQQISEYNEIMLQRNNHLANSSAQNPLVVDLNQHLVNMRQTIVQSLDNEQNILKARRNGIQSNRNKAVAKIASNPEQAKFLLSVERQQKVKESLYLFLLQKREENELSQAFTASGIQLIESPHGSSSPQSPVTRVIYLIAAIIGLGVPASVLFLCECLNTKVRGRKDLEKLNTPFVGEIPLTSDFIGKKKFQLKRTPDKTAPELLVKGMSLDIINEAFRIVRTNLEFILNRPKQSHVIMITSMNPGAGKTFVSANLAAAISVKDKKVLIIDMDLRRGSLSKYVGRPKLGVSNYLSGQESDYKSLIVKLDTIDVLPCGTFPPNPTELLSSQRYNELIDEVKASYDYVIIDCPPIEVVADTKIINRCVDMTLFVIRAHLFERDMLPLIDQWYEQKIYNNLAVLLNGTNIVHNSYGYHHYGYYGGYYYGSSKN